MISAMMMLQAARHRDMAMRLHRQALDALAKGNMPEHYRLAGRVDAHMEDASDLEAAAGVKRLPEASRKGHAAACG